MMRAYWKNFSYIMYLILGSALAYAFFKCLPLIKVYERKRQFQVKTEELALLIRNYRHEHPDYSALHISAFKDEQLPKGLYRHVNDTELEDLSAGRVQIFGSSSSKYEENRDAFTIVWRGINRFDCEYLATTNWHNLRGLKMIGLMVDNKLGQYDEAELYNGCQGGVGVRNGTVACYKGQNLSFPLSEKMAKQACYCPGNYCSVTFKYM